MSITREEFLKLRDEDEISFYRQIDIPCRINKNIKNICYAIEIVVNNLIRDKVNGPIRGEVQRLINRQMNEN